jgi:hypothetical protein
MLVPGVVDGVAWRHAVDRGWGATIVFTTPLIIHHPRRLALHRGQANCTVTVTGAQGDG